MRSFPSALVLFLACSATTALAQEASRLTTASNVRLRATRRRRLLPSSPRCRSARSLCNWTRAVRPPPGCGFGPEQRSRRLAAGRLTRRFTPETRIDAVEAIVKDRLARQGDSFGARVELLDLVERTLPGLTAPEPGGRFALLWLSALDNVSRPGFRGRRAATSPTPVAEDARGRRVLPRDGRTMAGAPAGRARFARPASRHVVGRRHRVVRGQRRSSRRVRGFVPCVLRRYRTALDGMYLRLHPAGRHVDESVTRLADALARMDDGPRLFLRSAKGLRRARDRGRPARGRRRRHACGVAPGRARRDRSRAGAVQVD